MNTKSEIPQMTDEQWRQLQEEIQNFEFHTDMGQDGVSGYKQGRIAQFLLDFQNLTGKGMLVLEEIFEAGKEEGVNGYFYGQGWSDKRAMQFKEWAETDEGKAVLSKLIKIK